MAAFNTRLDAEKARLAAQALPLDALRELLASDDFTTALAAGRHLLLRRAQSAQDAEAVMATMLAGLTHPHFKVRRFCADFMDHWGDQRCVEPLLLALRDPHESVRRLAMHSLCCQTCKVQPLQVDYLPRLIELAQADRSARVRRIATGILAGHRDDPRVIAALCDLAATSADLVVAARATVMDWA